MEIDQARLLTLYAAWKMDTEGKRAARQAISAIKVVAANMVMDVLDRAIQIHGSLGMTEDTPLAALWRFSRMLRIADGPDEVHKMVLARRELNRWAKRAEAEADRRAGAQARTTDRFNLKLQGRAGRTPAFSVGPQMCSAKRTTPRRGPRPGSRYPVRRRFVEPARAPATGDSAVGRLRLSATASDRTAAEEREAFR